MKSFITIFCIVAFAAACLGQETSKSEEVKAEAKTATDDISAGLALPDDFFSAYQTSLPYAYQAAPLTASSLLTPSTITVHNKYAVPVAKPFPVAVDKPVPVAVPVRYPVHVDKPYAVHVAKPYPVYVDKPVAVHKDLPYELPVYRSVPVHVLQKPSYTIIKTISKYHH